MTATAPTQFDALMRKIRRQMAVAPDDLDDMVEHLERMRNALVPFILLAAWLPEGAGITVGEATVTADDFAAAVTAYDMDPEALRAAEADHK